MHNITITKCDIMKNMQQINGLKVNNNLRIKCVINMLSPPILGNVSFKKRC